MKKIIIPKEKSERIEKIKITPNLTIGSTAGLIKGFNEDRIGLKISSNVDNIRICIADGHWGEKTSEIITDYWIKKDIKFPENRKEAIEEVFKLEQKLYRLFGNTNMDPNSDFTPEASFTTAQLVNNCLNVASYGDCRMILIRDGKIKTKLTTNETWLGVFSHLELRGRLSIKKALVYNKIKLKPSDTLLFFTDGVDQCVYEKDTISFEVLANLTSNNSSEKAFDEIFKLVQKAGAQDNASLIVLKI